MRHMKLNLYLILFITFSPSILLHAQSDIDSAFRLFSAGHNHQAAVLIDSLLSLSPMNTRLLFLKGQVQMNQNRHGAAVITLGKLLTLDPKHVDAHTLMARGYQELNRLKKATQCYEKAIRFAPDRHDLIVKLAVINYKRHAYRAASTLLQPILTTPDATPYRLALYGSCMLKMSQWDETLVWSKKALEQDSSHFANRLNLGLAYFHKNRIDSASVELLKATAINPDSDKGHYYLAEAQAKKKWIEAAISHHEQSIAIGGPFKWKSMKMLVKYYYHHKDLRSCLYHGQLYLEHEPQDSFVHHFMGRALADMGEEKSAESAFADAILYGNQDFIMMTYFYRAFNAYQVKRYREAISHYKTVIALDPSFAYAYYNIAITYDDYHKEKSAAIAHYKRFLELADPEKTEPVLLATAKERLSALNESAFLNGTQEKIP